MSVFKIKRNQAYRVYTGKDEDDNENIYDKISFWKCASDVVFDDGNSLADYMDYASGILHSDETEITIRDEKIREGRMVDVYVPNEYHKCCPKTMEIHDGYVTLEFPRGELRKPAYGNGNGTMEVRIVCHDGSLASESSTDPVEIDIVSWANGEDEKIRAMVQAAYNGKIDLNEYWGIGQEREAELNFRETVWNTTYNDNDTGRRVECSWTNPSNPVTVHLVLMDEGKFYTEPDIFSDDDDPILCKFVVGVKECLYDCIVPIQVSAPVTIQGHSATKYLGWRDSNARQWCNRSFYGALPDIRYACKNFRVSAYEYDDAGTSGALHMITDNYAALFSEKEVFGSCTHSNDIEDEYMTQIEYYKTVSNRVKDSVSTVSGQGGSATRWWLRSPVKRNSADDNYFCVCNELGNTGGSLCNTTNQKMSPFFVI